MDGCLLMLLDRKCLSILYLIDFRMKMLCRQSLQWKLKSCVALCKLTKLLSVQRDRDQPGLVETITIIMVNTNHVFLFIINYHQKGSSAMGIQSQRKLFSCSVS